MANTKIQSEQIADLAIVTDRIAADAVTTAKIADNVALGGSPTTTTQSASDNSTKIATTAYVTAAVANLIDSAPSTLNTLNEIAAALNDDANFNTTVTNSIAAKLPLAGGTMTGALNMGANQITNSGKITSTELTITGGSGTADLYINNTSPTLGFTDSNSFSDSSDIYIVRGGSTGDLLFQFFDDSANSTTTTLQIDETGNTTIAGTISSGDVEISDTSPLLTLKKSDETGRQSKLQHASGITKISSRNNASNGLISFEGFTSSATQEYARFDSSGDLIVGGTSSGANDAVSISNTGYIQAIINGDTAGYFNRRTSDGEIIRLQKDGSTVGTIGTVSGSLAVGGGDVFLEFNATSNVIQPMSSVTGGASNGVVDLGATLRKFKDLHLSGTANLDKIRIANTSDASLSSTDHAIQIGTTGGQNLIIDNNEVNSRNNGAAATLNLQVDGGTVTVGAATSANLTVSGTLATSSLFENKFANSNVAAPSTSDHTAGTRQVYYDGSATAWYARGIEGNTLWDNVDQDYKLYRQAALRLQWSESSQGFLPGADDAYDLGSSSKKWRSLYVEHLGAVANLHYIKGVFRKAVNVNKDFTAIFKVEGSALGSQFRFSVVGTTGNVVVNARYEILVNHSYDCTVQSLSGSYTETKVKVVSNANEDCTVYLAANTYNNNTASLSFEVETYNGEQISFDVSSPHTSAHFIHTATAGENTTFTGAMTAGAGTTTGYS